jgi:uncharacterized membrane protein YgdD (TMEM256/DUF423 family)
MIRKYLGYIEHTGVILMLIGCVGYRFMYWSWAIWICIVGLILFLGQVIFKAFNWKTYNKENKQNLIMMVVSIIFLWVLILYVK